MTVARAVLGFIDNRDRRAMRKFNRWRPPRWVRIWMIVASRLGDGWVWYALGAVLLFGGPLAHRAFVSAGVAAIVGIGIFCAVKRVSRRRRPCEIEPNCWAKILPPDRYSFPSGHSITAFAIAVAVGLYFPDAQPVLLFLAGSIALSRVLLGLHFVSDVVAGSFLGVLLGYSSFLIIR